MPSAGKQPTENPRIQTTLLDERRQLPTPGALILKLIPSIKVQERLLYMSLWTFVKVSKQRLTLVNLGKIWPNSVAKTAMKNLPEKAWILLANLM